MNYFDRIPHFALFLGFRYAKCGKHGLLPGDDMADGGLKPWPDGETKNPEINALKKPQKTSKVGKSWSWKILKFWNKIAKIVQKSEKKKSRNNCIEKADLGKSWNSQKKLQKLQKCPKIWKNGKFFKILEILDKTQIEKMHKLLKNVQKCLN